MGRRAGTDAPVTGADTSRGGPVIQRIDELVESGADDAAGRLASEAGDREALEAARVELQRRVRRNSRDHAAVRGLRLVSAALDQLPRDEEYAFFNRHKGR